MMKPVLLSLMLGLALAGCKTMSNPASIPTGEIASPPSASVPAEYARFSGLWAGSWGNGAMDGKLLVQSVDPKGAVETIYAWGDNEQWRITAGSTRAKGSIAGSVLTLEPFSNGAKAHYELQANGTLKGFYEHNDQVTLGRFTKQ